MQGGEEVAIVLLEEQILVKTCAYRKVNYKYFVSSQYTERIQKHLSFNTKILTNSFSIFDYYSKRPTEIKIRILKMQIFNAFEEFSFFIFFEIEMSLAYTHSYGSNYDPFHHW